MNRSWLNAILEDAQNSPKAIPARELPLEMPRSTWNNLPGELRAFVLDRRIMDKSSLNTVCFTLWDYHMTEFMGKVEAAQA